MQNLVITETIKSDLPKHEKTASKPKEYFFIFGPHSVFLLKGKSPKAEFKLVDINMFLLIVFNVREAINTATYSCATESWRGEVVGIGPFQRFLLCSSTELTLVDSHCNCVRKTVVFWLAGDQMTAQNLYFFVPQRIWGDWGKCIGSGGW